MESAAQIIWIKQIGTDSFDEITALTTDQEGNVLVAGNTGGAIEEGKHQGGIDGFFAKFSSEGEKLWGQQIGTSYNDEITALATDQQGNVFVAGWTQGAMEAGQQEEQVDGFIEKFSPAGEKLWGRQIGTNTADVITAMATDPTGNVLVAGKTYGLMEEGQAQGRADGFIAKYSPSGDKLWGRQIGTEAADVITALATNHEGNVAIAGWTSGAMEDGQRHGGTDGFIAKFSSTGEKLWGQQIGTKAAEYINALATDREGNVLAAGSTYGAMEDGQQKGAIDGFVAKFSVTGEKLWGQHVGTELSDIINALAVDQEGNVLVAGWTSGAIEAGQQQGKIDGFITKFSPGGEKLWGQQIGTKVDDEITALTTDQAGNIFIAGWTSGDIVKGQGKGGGDGFIAKIAVHN